MQLPLERLPVVAEQVATVLNPVYFAFGLSCLGWEEFGKVFVRASVHLVPCLRFDARLVNDEPRDPVDVVRVAQRLARLVILREKGHHEFVGTRVVLCLNTQRG